MCGIVGAFGLWLLDSQKERVKELLTVSNLRGYQGAGVVVSDNKCNVEVFKTVQTGTHLAHDPDFNHRLYHKKPAQATSVLIGHTRWPTKGAITLEATHPHSYDGITGVHNGTIDAIGGVRIGKDESDSALLYKSFADNGVKDTIQETEGAYCCVWIDEKEQTLNFLRNDKRPMYFAEMAGGSEIFFASERGMLDFVLGRQAPRFTVTQLVVDKWAVWDLPFKAQVSKTLTSSDLKGKAPPAVGAYYAPFRHWTGTTPAITQGEKTTESSSAKPTEPGAVTPSGKTGLTNTQTSTSLTVVPKNPTLGSSLSKLSPPHTDKTKPRMRFDQQLQTWVEVLPLPPIVKTVSPEVVSPTKPGGLAVNSNKSGEKPQESRKESPSTDGEMFSGDELVGERDFIPDDGTLQAQIDKMFPKTLFEGYRETITGNWMAEEVFLSCLGGGCLWCGDPQPDNETVTWTDVDEFMCQSCAKDEFGKDYVDLCQGLVNDPDTHDQRQIA